MTAKAQWLAGRLAYLRGLKAPTDLQKLLMLLADKPDRTPKEEKQLDALIRTEKAAEFAARTRAEAASIINAEKKAQAEAERKARTRRLIRVGEIALEMVDRGMWPRDELWQLLNESLTNPADRALFDLDAREEIVRPSQPPPAAMNWGADVLTQAMSACVHTFRSLSGQLKRAIAQLGETAK